MYRVKFEVSCRYEATVPDNVANIEDVIEKANEEFCEADFGDAFNIDGEAIVIYDDNDNEVWRRAK